MSSPHLQSRQTIGQDVFEELWSHFVTSRGGCGIRKMFRINGNKVARLVWEARRAAALSAHA